MENKSKNTDNKATDNRFKHWEKLIDNNDEFSEEMAIEYKKCLEADKFGFSNESVEHLVNYIRLTEAKILSALDINNNDE